MLITFKTHAAGDVIMFGNVAQQMLDLIGKDHRDAQGIVTLKQLPNAIASLERAITADKGRAIQEEPEGAERNIPKPVALWQRAVPLLELFRYALRDEQPVIWEGTQDGI